MVTSSTGGSVSANKENPVSFKVTYPSDYSLASVKGKEVTFYVCVNGVAGTSDELLTEKVLKDDVKYTPADDDEYKNDLVKSFLNMAKKTLDENYESTKRTNALAAIWEKLLEEKAVVIKYPSNIVNSYYDSMVAELKSYYSQYSSQAEQDTTLTKYSSLQDFATYY